MSWGGAAAGMTVLVLALKRRQVIGAFERVGSTSPETARTPEELGLGASRTLRRLQRWGVLRPTGDGAYYLDRILLSRKRRRRRIAVVAVLAILAAGGLVLVLTGYL